MFTINKGEIMKLALRCGIVLLALMGICFAAEGPTFKEGKWSITTVIKMDGNSAQAAEMQKAMKEMENMPPAAREMMKKMQGSGGGMKTTNTQCISNNNPVPNMNAGKDKNSCQQTHDVRGNTVTFHSVCKEPDGQVEVNGEMTFTGDTMKGTIKSHQLRKGEAVDTTIEMSGNYLGPCK
jgi:hypothetical protein